MGGALLFRPGRVAAACVALGLALAVAPAAAAPITWGAAQDTLSAADVSTDGLLMEAVNATGLAASPVVNGVPFTASDALLSSSFTGDALNGATTGDAALDALLAQFDYGGGVSTSISVGGGALLAGTTYQIQVFFTDLRGCCSSRDMTFGDGLGSSVDLDATGAGFGQYAVGSFVADAGSQTLSLDANGFANAHVTAYQVREVFTPEPGSAPLLGLALVTLAALRRRALR